jgi:hypothetical protein
LRLALDGRLAAMMWVVLFCICMVYVYFRFLYPSYWYLGFPLSPGEHPVLWLSVPLVLISGLMLPAKLLRLADFAVWMLFFFVYVPSMLFVPLQGLLPDDGLVFVCSLTASFSILRLGAMCSIRVPVPRVTRSQMSTLVLGLFVVLNAYVFSVYGNNLKLAGIADVYLQRAEASDLAEGTLVGYASGILSGAINPFLIAVGLTERRRAWLWLGIFGQIFVYATAAMKSVVLSVLLMPIFYYFLIRRPSISPARLGVLILGSCMLPLAAAAMAGESDNPIAVQLIALIFMRTYGMAGALSGVYADFFASHPYTYFSHINLVSMFVSYPYAQSIGEEVGLYMVGSKLDANANFWVSDGLAALSYPGVVLMGAVFGAFLALTNGMLPPGGRRLAMVAWIPFIVSVSNASFFTALLTGGGGLLVALIYLWQARSQPVAAGRVG